MNEQQRKRQQNLAVERAKSSINWLVKNGDATVLKSLLSELHLQPAGGNTGKKLEQQPASTSLSRTTQTATPSPAPAVKSKLLCTEAEAKTHFEHLNQGYLSEQAFKNLTGLDTNEVRANLSQLTGG